MIYHHEDNIRRVQFHNQGVVKYVTCLKEFLDNPRLEFSSVFNIMAHSVIGAAPLKIPSAYSRLEMI